MAGTASRKTIFSNEFKHYDDAYIKNMAYTGEKIGPGPSINVREVNLDQKPSSKKTTIGQESRKLGEPYHKPGQPGPGDYRLQEKSLFKQKTSQKFTRGHRVVDFIKYNPGHEILIQKGLH